MHVRIIQAGDDRAATAVDHFRSRSTLPQDFISRTDSADFAVFDSERFDKRRNSIRRYPRVVQYTVGFHAWLLIGPFAKTSSSSRYLCAAAADGTTYSGNFVGVAPWTMVYAYSTPAPYAP